MHNAQYASFPYKAKQEQDPTKLRRAAFIPSMEYTIAMKYEIEYTNQFGEWWTTLSQSEQDDIVAVVDLLEEKGWPFC